MPSALILIADGTEEMEFTIAFDTLVRGGISCTSAYVPTTDTKVSGPIIATCSRGLKIIADLAFPPAEPLTYEYDLLVIPGGAKGAETISQNVQVQNLVRNYITLGKLVGMICAGSLTALTSGLPKQPITSHPSVKAELDNAFEYSEDPVVVSGTLVTSRGPGTAFPFALILVAILCGAEKREEIRAPMVFPEGTLW